MQSLTTQAQIIAAAVAGSATVDTGSIVIDPDSLADSNDEVLPDTEQMSSLDFPIDPEAVGPILKRLLANTTVRARIIDKDGNIFVADGAIVPKAIGLNSISTNIAGWSSVSNRNWPAAI